MSTLSILTRSRALAPAGSGVPWATVTTLAAGLSCTCAFWLVSLQGAIGATERSETPFHTWLMLSAALLPVFCAFVVGAMILAKRRFGHVLTGSRAVLTTGLLLVVGGTLVGLAAIVVSSVYDFHLQVRHVQGGLHAMAACTGSCIPREQHAIFVLHVRGVMLTGRWLLLSNALLVAWLLAAWGGRMRLATGPSRGEVARDRGPAASGVADDVRLLLVGALTGAAVIGTTAVPARVDEWTAAGVLLVVLTTAKIGLAGLLLGHPRGRLPLLGAAALAVASLAVWAWSHAPGPALGAGPGLSGGIGVPDVVAGALEVGALLAALALLNPGRLVRPAVSPHARALAGLTLVAVTVIGLAATGPGWFDAFGVGSSHATSEIHADSGAGRVAIGGQRS